MYLKHTEQWPRKDLEMDSPYYSKVEKVNQKWHFLAAEYFLGHYALLD